MFGRFARLRTPKSNRSTRTIALCLAAAVPFAYQVREYPATESSIAHGTDPQSSTKRVHKKWELTGGVYAINTVKVDLPGVVHVAHEDQNLAPSLATVNVASDSEALADCIEVVQLPPNGVKLRFKSKECAQLRGHLLTTISLAVPQQVNQFHARGGSVVVVDDGVLVTDCEHASVDVSLHGSGQLHVVARSQDINLSRLNLSVEGRGSFQFIGPPSTTIRDRLLLEVAGSGSLRSFMGAVDTSLLKTSLAGPGSVYFGLKDTLRVDMLKTSIADTGDGCVQYDGEGQCRIQRCSVVGSGKLLATGVRSEKASTNVAVGHADVTMHVVEELKASGWGSTTLRYVGQPPRSIEGKSVSLRPASIVSMDRKLAVPEQVPSPSEAFESVEALYEAELIPTDDSSTVGRATRFLVNTFVGDEVKRARDREARKKKKEGPEKEKENTAHNQ